MEGYKIYRIYYFIFRYEEGIDKSKELIKHYRECVIIIEGVAVLDEIILILISFSTFKCIGNFGKGLKEMLIKQNQALNSSAQLSESI